MFKCRKCNQLSGYDTKTGTCVKLNIYVERGTRMTSKRDNHVIVFWYSIQFTAAYIEMQFFYVQFMMKKTAKQNLPSSKQNSII